MCSIFVIPVTLYLTITIILAVNVNRNESFLTYTAPEKNTSAALKNDMDMLDTPELETKGNGMFGKVKNFFYTDGRAIHKTQNNTLLLDFAGFKNIRNKKEVESKVIQVQKSLDLITNNTDKGLLHFKASVDKLSDKGTVNRATFKITKLFDGKELGIKCPTNAVKLYLVQPPNENMKMNVLKGPIKLEFKKNELEVDVSSFFNDLEVPQMKTNLSGNENLLQFQDSGSEPAAAPAAATSAKGPDSGAVQEEGGAEERDGGLEFDQEGDEKPEGEDERNEEEFFGEGRRSSEGLDLGLGPRTVDKYLMLEADPNCYFAFDAIKSKPKVKLEMTKKTVTRLKQANKVAIGGVASVISLLVFGGLFMLFRNRRTDYTYFYNNQNDMGAPS